MRAALLAFALVLFAACDPAPASDDGECAEGTASGLSIVINGAAVASDLNACASQIGAGVIVSLPGWELNVGTGGQPGSYQCNYEQGGIMATLTRLDGSNDQWEAYGGEPESSCTVTVSDATASGTPISGSFAGQLIRYPLEGGKEVADVSFSFYIPAI